MPYVWEIVLGAIAVGSAVAMLTAAYRKQGLWKEWQAYGLDLLAWVPTWFIGRFLWHWLTGHESYGYPWYFWVLLVLGVALAILMLLLARYANFIVIRVIGIVLVAIALWNLGWFSPSTWLATWYTHPLVWLAIALVVIMIVVRRIGVILVCAAGLVLLLLIAALNYGFSRPKHEQARPTPGTSVPSQTPTGSPSPTSTPTPTADCPDTWEIKSLGHDLLRVVDAGNAKIQAAKTPAQARVAANDVVPTIQVDPAALSGFAANILHKDVPPATLVNGQCASATAKALAVDLQLAIANATVTPDYAPANGRNTGIENGRMVSATTSGITGNRKAIKLVLKDGTTIWIMARCLNIVTIGKSPLPPGKTERQPTPQTSISTPPTTNHSPTPSTTSCVRKPKPGPGYVESGPCDWKKEQTRSCMINPQNSGCPQPSVGQPVQSNPSQPTGRTSGAPTTAPPPPVSTTSTTAPGGSGGTSTGTPSGTLTCNPDVGCGSDHTQPPPTGIG